MSKICKPLQDSRRQRLTWSTFHTKDAQTLDPTLQNVFDWTIPRPGSLRPCSNSRCYREDQASNRSLAQEDVFVEVIHTARNLCHIYFVVWIEIYFTTFQNTFSLGSSNNLYTLLRHCGVWVCAKFAPRCRNAQEQQFRWYLPPPLAATYFRWNEICFLRLFTGEQRGRPFVVVWNLNSVFEEWQLSHCVCIQTQVLNVFQSK